MQISGCDWEEFDNRTWGEFADLLNNFQELGVSFAALDMYDEDGDYTNIKFKENRDQAR